MARIRYDLLPIATQENSKMPVYGPDDPNDLQRNQFNPDKHPLMAAILAHSKLNVKLNLTWTFLIFLAFAAEQKFELQGFERAVRRRA
jgi:hypothetical protein